ncbi:hypothetical protein BDZ90DRAFT_97303 [Jaminaea rosea]|uniref:Uncharacterized protein n=1 Tax=Jaminaea rosea TaxID=1569628 RepID=A0A316UIY4_9BASI|nr:hypothetical protein BDZ90DRAFT_97303 [Jaminaea rosea]PWN24828.1 hypothetical protein BDZ90DRAFT_97303 [Jaminaea rosea]
MAALSSPPTLVRTPPSLRRLDPRPGGLPNTRYRRNALRSQTPKSSSPPTDSISILDKAIAAAASGSFSDSSPPSLALLPLRVRRAPSLTELRVLNTASSSARQRRRRRRANSWSPGPDYQNFQFHLEDINSSPLSSSPSPSPPPHQDAQPFQANFFVHSDNLTPSTASTSPSPLDDRQLRRLSSITEVSNSSEEDQQGPVTPTLLHHPLAATMLYRRPPSASEVAPSHSSSHPFKAASEPRRSRSCSSTSSQATIVDATPQSSYTNAFAASSSNSVDSAASASASTSIATSSFPQPPPRAETRDGSLCSSGGGAVMQGLGLGIVPDDALLDDDVSELSLVTDEEEEAHTDEDDEDDEYRPPQPRFLDRRSHSLPLPTLDSTLHHRRARKAEPGFTILLDQGSRDGSIDSLNMLRRPSAPLSSVPLPNVCCVRRDSVDGGAARYYDAPVSPSLHSSDGACSGSGIGSGSGTSSSSMSTDHWANLIEYEYRGDENNSEETTPVADVSAGSGSALGLSFDADIQARRPGRNPGYDTKLRVTGIPWLDDELRAEGALDVDESPALPETPPELLCGQESWLGDDDDEDMLDAMMAKAFKPQAKRDSRRLSAMRPATAKTIASIESTRTSRSDSINSMGTRASAAISFNSEPTHSQVPERKRKKLQAKLRLLASLPMAPPRTTSLAPTGATTSATTSHTSTTSSHMSLNSAIFPIAGLSSTLPAPMNADHKQRRLASMGEAPAFPSSVGDDNQVGDERQMLAALAGIVPTSVAPLPARPPRRTPSTSLQRNGSGALRESRSTTAVGRRYKEQSAEVARPSILVGKPSDSNSPRSVRSTEHIGASPSIRFRREDDLIRPTLRRAASNSSAAAASSSSSSSSFNNTSQGRPSTEPKENYGSGRRSFGDMLRPSMDLLRPHALQAGGGSSRSNFFSRSRQSPSPSPESTGSNEVSLTFKERTLGGRVAKSVDFGSRLSFWNSDEARESSHGRAATPVNGSGSGSGGWLKKSRSRLRMMAA